MSGLIFNEESMINGNIFKFEERLHSRANKYVERGMLLTTYFSLDDESTTVDRGTNDIEELFGKRSPLRHKKINNVPLYGFGQTNPSNTDEMQIEDINVEGDCTVIPGTIIPKVLDFFIINHLKMRALFVVNDVQYDSMKVDGFYKIHYKLMSTSEDRIKEIEEKVTGTYYTDLDAVGSDVDPIIKEDDFIFRKKIQQMVNSLIQSYRAMFYNDRHNCFLFNDHKSGYNLFDMCGNEFIAKHSLMNPDNATNVIVLHSKIRDPQSALFYNNSVYNWLELDAPSHMLQPFFYVLNDADLYPDSSFSRWGDIDVQIIQPISLNQYQFKNHSFFDNTQFNAFLDSNMEPTSSEYDKLIWKYIHKRDTIGIGDVSLYTADALISAINHIDVYLYTPIVIYIIRKILRMN